MSDACQPIFRYGGCTSNPVVPDGTRMVLISPGPVRAVTVTNTVISVPELVMKAFSPFDPPTPPPRRRAPRVVRVPPASLPGLGLGEAEAAQGAPHAEVGKPRLLLLLGAEAVDRVGAQPHARLEGDGHRVINPGQLLDGDAEHREVATATAVRLGEGDAEEPQLPHAAHHVDGEVVIAVPRFGVRSDLEPRRSHAPHVRSRRRAPR